MKKYIYIFLLTYIMIFISCDDGFEELNVNPQKPVTADVRAVYNGISSSYPGFGTEQTFLRNELLYSSTQLAGLSRKIGVDPFSRVNLFNGLYTKLANIRWVEDELTKEETFNVTNASAMVKIAKAYFAFKITDFYGDIPFTEAGKAYLSGENQNVHPVYDDSKTIYLACLEDLKWAVDNIVESPDNTYLSFAGTDAFYSGDMLKWKKLANTLRLRYALRISEKEPALAAEIISDAINKPLIETKGEAFVFDRIAANSTGTQSGSFRAAGSAGVRLGQTMWNAMSDSNDEDGSGIFDPRIYVYFEPNMDDKWIAVSQDFEAGISPIDEADVYDRNRIADYDHPTTHVNHYAAVNTNLIHSSTDRTPIVTLSEAYFLKAEIYARGIGVTANMTMAEENYYAGINASVDFWYDVVDSDLTVWNDPLSVNVPPTVTEIDNLLNHPQVIFTGTDSEKLNKIYEQRWVSLFWLPEEAHFLQSRTGGTPLTGTRGNFYRLPYPDTEGSYNLDNYNAAVTKMGGDDSTIKLWWMK
jgi:hypothetical protein